MVPGARRGLGLLPLALLCFAAVACQAAPQGKQQQLRPSPKPAPRPLPKPAPRPKPTVKPSTGPPRPLPKPRPSPAAPFRWVSLTAAQHRRADQLLSIFENSDVVPAYGYAENLDDDRGVTFGRSGFCTGTGDGLLVVREYVALSQQRRQQRGQQTSTNNTLARFLPTLERIDRAGGGDSPLLAGPAQKAFIQAVQAASKDPLFRQAQDKLNDQLYFQPSQQMAKSLGLRLALSKAQLYDAYVQHGESDPGYPEYQTSANGMAEWASKQLRGSPLQGVNERLWLKRFMERRRSLLRGSGDSGWAGGAQRVDIYLWILQYGDTALSRPLRLSWARCRADGQPGPCSAQPPRGGELRMGGIVYGDFLLH